MIYQEEQLFRKSLAVASGLTYPILPENADEETLEKHRKAKEKYEKGLDKALNKAFETKEIPDGVIGLAPDGDRTVLWRWMGPVYEDTPQDKVNQSIFTRNLQELGVDSIEALKYLFPSKTDDEVAEMLSGYPFRMVGQVQRAYASFLDLINQEMRTPHPQRPDLPLAADPRLDLTPFLYRTLESLQKEVTYAGRYRSADPIGTPTVFDPAEQLRGTGGTTDGSAGTGGNNQPMGSALPAGPSTSTPDAGANLGSPVRPYPIVPASPTFSGEPVQGGIQPGGVAPEFTSSIPVPGSTVRSDTRNRPGQLQFPTDRAVQQQFGSPDLSVQPGLLAQLFPNIAGNNNATTSGKRSKSSKS